MKTLLVIGLTFVLLNAAMLVRSKHGKSPEIDLIRHLLYILIPFSAVFYLGLKAL